MLGINPIQILLYPRIINTQELGRTSSHVVVIMFTFSTLTIHELIDWVIRRHVFQQTVHNLKQCLTQVGRALLGYMPVLGSKLTGLIWRCFQPGKANQRRGCD